MIACVVAPFDQRYDAPGPAALAVSVTLPPPQSVVGPLAVIDGAGGFVLTKTLVEAELARQPEASVIVTL